MLASRVMASKLTRDDVLRVATLARLELTDAEIDTFTGQLAAILDYAGEIQKIDTTGVAPTSHALGEAPAWREDTPEPSLDRHEILERAPGADQTAGLFKVPKVL
jgi:aspartyl-tRNA(Asn)/glutamyl-tRNA(Gln) amidotransferase subunit C